jgi:hypothetical protein
MGRSGDCLGGLRERFILVSDKFVAGEGGNGYACANRYAIFTELDLRQFVNAG